MSGTVSVVVPVYNEQENIDALAEELQRVAGPVPGLEVLLVDDGSRDATWQKIQDCRKRFSAIHGIHYAKNRGQSGAMLVGLQQARGDVLVTMDGDLQNNPADIPMMLKELEGVDVVCGYRANRKDTWARRIGSRLANRIRNRYTQDGIRDTGCSLKVFRRHCVADLPPVTGVHRFMPAYFRLNGRTIREVPVDHRPRTAGVSKYTNLKRLPKTIFDLIGFIWYRSRYLPGVAADSLERC